MVYLLVQVPAATVSVYEIVTGPQLSVAVGVPVTAGVVLSDELHSSV
jgi:hypothetical protein